MLIDEETSNRVAESSLWESFISGYETNSKVIYHSFIKLYAGSCLVGEEAIRKHAGRSSQLSD